MMTMMMSFPATIDEARLVNVTFWVVLALVFMVTSAVWFRYIVFNLAISPELRKSCRLISWWNVLLAQEEDAMAHLFFFICFLGRFTYKTSATCTGIVLFLGVLIMVLLKQNGDLRASMFSWHPLAMITASVILSPAAIDFVTMRFAAKVHPLF
jgi:hypothetical protein